MASFLTGIRERKLPIIKISETRFTKPKLSAFNRTFPLKNLVLELCESQPRMLSLQWMKIYWVQLRANKLKQSSWMNALVPLKWMERESAKWKWLFFLARNVYISGKILRQCSELRTPEYQYHQKLDFSNGVQNDDRVNRHRL